jgi:3-oxoadipate enol-lactonase
VTLHHVIEGKGPPLVLAGSLGTTHRLWNAQVGILASHHLVVRYDHPGHGGSPPGPRTIEGLARDVLALADELGLRSFAFCGLSLGGMVGMWLAAHEPARITQLVLGCTAARLPPRRGWLERAATVRTYGVAAIADGVLGRWFTPRFRDVEPWRAMLVSTPREGYARCCEAIADVDLRDELAGIAAPTVVVLGRDDPVVDDVAKRELRAIRNVRVIELAAAHLANVEQPVAFANAVLAA